MNDPIFSQLGINTGNKSVENIEEKEAKEKIVFGESIERLLKNQDFQRVIMNGFLKDNILRAAKNKTSPAFQNAALQNALESQLIGASALNEFLRMNMSMAVEIKEALKRADEEEEDDD